MNYNKMQENNRWKMVLILALCFLAVGATIYLKMSTGEAKNLRAPGEKDSSLMQVAVPDTTVDPTVMPTTTDTVTSVLSDTILGRDKRDPYDGGYEDGYAAGCDDGASNANRASYDEESSYQQETDRQKYTEGYREGYSKGFEDGKQGKQFNIGN